MKRPNAPRLIDIVEASDKIASFLAGPKTFDDFVNDDMLLSAVLYQLVIIGEAATHLSEELKARYDKEDWTQIKGFRNFIVHEYWGTALQIVWNAATLHAPSLRKYCVDIYREQFPDLLEYLPDSTR